MRRAETIDENGKVPSRFHFFSVQKLSVFGSPKPQPRPRAFVRKTKTGPPVARVFDAGTAENWKSRIAASANGKRPPGAPLDCPIRVELRFIMPRPQSLRRKKDPAGPIPHTKRPDVDNLAKAVLDCLSELGWWVDDTRVAELEATKEYASKEGVPGLELRVLVAKE